MCNILLSYPVKRTVINNPEIHSSAHVGKRDFHFLPVLWPSGCGAFYAKLDDEYDVNKCLL